MKEFEEYRSKRLADWTKQKAERMAIRNRKWNILRIILGSERSKKASGITMILYFLMLYIYVFHCIYMLFQILIPMN